LPALQIRRLTDTFPSMFVFQRNIEVHPNTRVVHTAFFHPHETLKLLTNITTMAPKAAILANISCPRKHVMVERVAPRAITLVMRIPSACASLRPCGISSAAANRYMAIVDSTRSPNTAVAVSSISSALVLPVGYGATGPISFSGSSLPTKIYWKDLARQTWQAAAHRQSTYLIEFADSSKAHQSSHRLGQQRLVALLIQNHKFFWTPQIHTLRKLVVAFKNPTLEWREVSYVRRPKVADLAGR
jgi:hypothetical protein